MDKDKKRRIYVSLDCDPAEEADFLNGDNCEKIELAEGLGGLDIRREYIDFIGRLNRERNSARWWANSISYKGTFVSDLFQETYRYYCLISLIDKREEDLVLVSGDAVLNGCLLRYCALRGIGCRVVNAAIEGRNRALHVKRYVLNGIRFMLNGWRIKILVSFHLGGKIRRTFKKRASYQVIKSWIDDRAFDRDGSYSDIYFGGLPGYLKRMKRDFIILTGSLTGYKGVMRKIKAERDFIIIPQEYFSGYLDYLKVFLSSFAVRPRIRGRVMFCGIELTDLVKVCLDRDYEENEINNNLSYYYHMKGLSRKVIVRNFIYVFENRAWERISILSLRRHSPLTMLTGYVHSSIRQSYLPYFQAEGEKDVVPSPDRVLTTGDEPAFILSSAGNYGDKVSMSAACALRYERLLNNGKSARNKNGNILAAFSIDRGCSLRLLKFLNSAFSGDSGRRVVLRPHPYTPLEDMIKRCGLKVNSNLGFSRNLSLSEDLKDAGAFIYMDSTASMEALMRGIPAIHIDFKDALDRDPFFSLNSLKWRVSDKAELLKAVDYIYSMEDEEYSRRHEEAVSYLNRYFRPVEDKYLEMFVYD